MATGIEVLGYVFAGVIIFAAGFLALMCYHHDAKRKKQQAEERTTATRNGNTNFRTDGNAVRQANAPIWTTQISMVEHMEGHTHNTLPRIEQRYQRREMRRQSDVDILFGNATIFGFANEGIQIEETRSEESVDMGHDGDRRKQEKDGLPSYHEALQLPKKGDQS